MPHAYSEDQLVEQPAIQIFASMGWTTVSAQGEVTGVDGTLGRETLATITSSSAKPESGPPHHCHRSRNR
jgi:hypothetical protein